MSRLRSNPNSMSISPVSNVSGANGSHQTQATHNPAPHKPSGSASSPTDTIHLSQAAQAHLQSGDKNHDGDKR